MFAYYLRLALRSLKRNKGLTAVMILAIALGVGAAMTTLTVFYVLSGDPIPAKSDVLFYPQLDPRPAKGAEPGEKPVDQMMRMDAENLLRDAKGVRQAVMTGGNVTIKLPNSTRRPMMMPARYTSADFFPMFSVAVREGRAWTKADDDGRARVAVISQKLNEKLFGGVSGVGQSLLFDNTAFRVVGVLGDFSPKPRFYDMSNSRYSNVEDVFIPFSTSRELNLDTQGGMNCWGRSPQDAEGSRGLAAPCSWLQYWVELRSPEDAANYRAYLENYSRQQKAAGRYERAPNVALHNVMQWLDVSKAVPSDIKLQMWLAFGFLLVCLLNTVGLLLAKFMRRSGEFGVRRALGASRRTIFAQCLVEAGIIGVIGGLMGIGLAAAGLWLIRQQPDDYAALAKLDIPMLLATVLFAIAASVLAGLLPSMRACRIAPAIQLKSQ